MQAFSYLRVSGISQVEGDGFPRQSETISRFAQGKGIEVIAEFPEMGVCGENELADRPALTDLLTHLQATNIRTILVERSDRLARDLIAGEMILRECRRLGVQVISAEGSVDLTNNDSPTTVLIRQILGAVSQFEKASIVQKLRAAKHRKRKQEPGWKEGRKAYGKKEGEAPIAARIIQERRAGKTLTEIADRLNAENIPTREGKRWQPQTIKNICKRAG